MVVIGTTLGAFMAIQMAHDRPGRIAGIVLNDVGTDTTRPGSKRLHGTVDHQEWSLDIATANAKAMNEKYFPEFGEDDWMVHPPVSPPNGQRQVRAGLRPPDG